MPNLFSDLPVAILAWVRASTSGLTRSEMSVRAALGGGDGREPHELRLGFDVDAEDAGIDRGGELGLGLADPGEHDFLRRDAGERARA